jgi:hypothetical protein
VRLFLGKSRVGGGCFVDTRSENAVGLSDLFLTRWRRYV